MTFFLSLFEGDLFNFTKFKDVIGAQIQVIIKKITNKKKFDCQQLIPYLYYYSSLKHVDLYDCRAQ